MTYGKIVLEDGTKVFFCAGGRDFDVTAVDPKPETFEREFEISELALNDHWYNNDFESLSEEQHREAVKALLG